MLYRKQEKENRNKIKGQTENKTWMSDLSPKDQ